MNPINGTNENKLLTKTLTPHKEETKFYIFNIEDEPMWARPWSADLLMKETLGPLFEHACHEGNYGLYNTLVGARLEEAEEAAARKPN